MLETSIPIGQWLTVTVMAVALGFDALSLCLGIGLRGIRRLHMLRVSLMIGLFHVIMPLVGVMAGQWMSGILGQVTGYAAGMLLVLLGGHMIYSSLRGEASDWIQTTTWTGTILFALSVSVDSFSVGVSLGMFQTELWSTMAVFGFFGVVMSIMGLKLGHVIGQKIGEYGEACGGAVLLTFGVLFILG